MTRIVAALLLVLEPFHLATEVVTVLPTIAPRGLLAGVELMIHGAVAALAAAAGLALWNAAPDGRRLGRIAVAAVVVRTLQSLYWSVLPDNTMPGDEPVVAGIAVVIGSIAIAVLSIRGRR